MLVANSCTISRYALSAKSAISLVNRINLRSASLLASLIRHCHLPPGPLNFSHSSSKSFLKYSLSHFKGCIVQGPSKPAVYVSSPLPVPHRPGHGIC